MHEWLFFTVKPYELADIGPDRFIADMFPPTFPEIVITWNLNQGEKFLEICAVPLQFLSNLFKKMRPTRLRRRFAEPGLTFVAAVQQRFGEHICATYGGDLRLHSDLRPLRHLSVSVGGAQQLHIQLLQFVAPHRQGSGTLGVVAQVAVAGQLHGPDQAVQGTVAVPGVVIDAEVGEAAHGEQDLLGRRPQTVVLEEQRSELREAGERSILHHRDVVLLQVQAL